MYPSLRITRLMGRRLKSTGTHIITEVKHFNTACSCMGNRLRHGVLVAYLQPAQPSSIDWEELMEDTWSFPSRNTTTMLLKP